MEDALIAHAKAVSIRLDVHPQSKESAVLGYDEWRKRIRVSVKERPRAGTANENLVGLLSKLFAVDRGRVRITKGLHSRRKTVVVEGISKQDALEKLSRELQ